MASIESDIVCDLKERGFSLRSPEEKRAIVKKGRITPTLKALQKYGKTARQFQTSWYGSYKWLTGSTVSNKVYCWPCLLLTTKKSTWSSEGYSDWKNLSRSASLHCSSKEHIQNEVSLKRLEREETPVGALLSEQRRLAILQYNDNVRKNREVLKRLIDISVVLSRQELAFHGYDEPADLINQGNYRELFDCFFRHNDELRAHWQRNSTVFSGLSRTIQNELIDCIAEEIRLHIDQEIKECSFFACEVDKTTDISQMNQLSLVLRYVDKNGNPQERFMGFKDVSIDQTAVALKQVMDSVISKYDYKTKLVSQSYDGAVVMPGELGGLQAIIKMEAPQAIFVHSFAHQLNLILQQGAQCIKETRCFFATLDGFATFFTYSSKRSELLDRIVGRRIPSLCAMEWTSNSRVLHAILSEREVLCDVFQEIVDGPGWDGESRRQASVYLASLKDFHFLFLAFSYCNIFSITDILYDILQKMAVDVNYCIWQIQQMTEMIQDLRKEERFKEIFNDVATIVAGLHQAAHKHRWQDGSFEDNMRTYSRLYYEIIDNIIVQLTLRFADMKALRFLELADSSRFPSFREQFPSEAFTSLSNSYGSYFDLDRLKNEFGVIFSDDQFQKYSVCDILHIIIENELRDVLKEAYLFFCLIATIPATTVSVERSFSCLKRIKTYLRSTMDQGHLSALATISIEKELLAFLEKQPTWYDDVIARFASKQDRQLDLLYK
ncbi:uncharacterized protein LOC102349681 [Latimeria chalumnae]|uniref:TTF-type domain-containing protein n=1 Tax=Latimeria chalumnae TaxID=7897 RepID=H3AFA7_LATCH|nr:PREDICTED: uncharacterized protein LOC102349681 [Latimeria chalumnae]XP_006009467.1 PREDICTED: uncharacterized protein LOC102349681 [Latimeria chalumnae]|eukprot:XP_006009466.1 PREDICTED: uncharacterized protein LOC102349681 [Latimeria chalumnae]